MIHFILLQNRMGKTRLCKWYVPCDDAERDRQKVEVHRLVTARESRFTNFVEYRSHKIIYRRYAGLYFSFCVDVNDNEMAMLELIHLFVETLDFFFGNVCELDIVFHFHRVYMILDEMILAGEIQEVSKPTIVARVQALDQLQ
jgi:AP-2 complex subunit sigma-1